MGKGVKQEGGWEGSDAAEQVMEVEEEDGGHLV